jgi:hypothetical protein
MHVKRCLEFPKGDITLDKDMWEGDNKVNLRETDVNILRG